MTDTKINETYTIEFDENTIYLIKDKVSTEIQY